MKRSPIKLRRHPASAAERRAYRDAADAVRNEEGYVVCGGCRRPLLDESVQLHHVVFRSRGGTSTPENLKPLCVDCHQAVHQHLIDACTPYEAE